MSLITVAISARNRPALLRRAIRSVLDQKYQDFHVLVSDNGSAQNLCSIIDEFKDARIEYFRHNKTLRMIDSWRFALTYPVTKYVAWLHDDDYWLSDHLLHAVEALEKTPGVGLFSCAVDHVNENGLVDRQILTGWEHLTEPKFFTSREVVPLWLRRFNAQCSSLVFRRSALDSISWGPRDMKMASDYLIAGQVAFNTGWIYHPKCTAHYWLHGGCVVKTDLKAFSLWSVQSSYVVRFLGAHAIRVGVFDERELIEAIRFWSLDRIAGLVVSFYSLSAHVRLRRFSAFCIREYPEILTGEAKSRSCQLAGKIGRWYLAIADYINFIRVGWYPI